MKNNRDKKQSVLKKYSHVLFNEPASDPQNLLAMALGDTKPRRSLVQEATASWPEDIDHELLSYGQYISYFMQINNIEISYAKEKLNIEQIYFESILDDEYFPWELEIDIQKKIIDFFSMNKDKIIFVISHHPIIEENLEKKIGKKYNFAARSNKELTAEEREEELKSSLLEMQRKKEEKKKVSYIQKLETII